MPSKPSLQARRNSNLRQEDHRERHDQQESDNERERAKRSSGIIWRGLPRCITTVAGKVLL